MKINRNFTTAGKCAYDDIKFTTTSSEIKNPDGSIVFQLENVEVPENWSQVASDVIAQKYFRKAGVPTRTKKVKRKMCRNFYGDLCLPLTRHLPVRLLLSRSLTDLQARGHIGVGRGYFSSEKDAQSYLDEMRYMLATQMAAPNSPQWFNTGLHWAYGIDGPSQGHSLCRL